MEAAKTGDMNLRKLYVVVDPKLQPGQQTSQAIHAASQFMLDYPGVWNNETVVVLHPPEAFYSARWTAAGSGNWTSEFQEPDYKYVVTGVAVLGATTSEIFKDYPLLSFAESDYIRLGPVAKWLKRRLLTSQMRGFESHLDRRT